MNEIICIDDYNTYYLIETKDNYQIGDILKDIEFNSELKVLTIS